MVSKLERNCLETIGTFITTFKLNRFLYYTHFKGIINTEFQSFNIHSNVQMIYLIEQYVFLLCLDIEQMYIVNCYRRKTINCLFNKMMAFFFLVDVLYFYLISLKKSTCICNFQCLIILIKISLTYYDSMFLLIFSSTSVSRNIC